MVKVLVIADEVAPNLHVQALRSIAPDLVLAAGDLPWDYLEYVADTVNVPMLFVPGNHDPELERAKVGRNGVCTTDGMPCDSPRPRGVVNVDQTVVSAAGLRVAGLGGCVRYRPGAHQYTQRQYRGRARRLLRRARSAGPVDVLLTHAPPLGLGDGQDGPHIGIEALHGVLDRLTPTWHLHGHIHPYGQKMPDRELGRTTLRNVIPWKVLDVTAREPASDSPRRGRRETLGSW
jgi:hypothetical protein